MVDFLKFLESEIERTGQAIEEAQIKFNTLQDLRRKYLESQGAKGHDKTIPSNLPKEHISLDPATFTHDDDNKTQLVLDTILHHQPQGVKAGRVFAAVTAGGVSINRNYVYSILNRLKKRGKIQCKHGKYYPTLSALAPTPAGGKSSAT